MSNSSLSFRWQSAMSSKDWAMLGVLLVISVGLWTWVYSEYQKPVVDPDWLAGRVEAQREEPAL